MRLPASTEIAGHWPRLAALSVVAAVMMGLPAASQTLAPATSSAEEVERFCGNIVDAARDRRYALQTAELETLRGEVDERIRMLEAKRAEYEDWLSRRDRFMKQAQATVVEIYAKMRPDAAAGQLGQLRAETAAAILMSLDPRQASVILNEMEMKTAAALTGIMVSAAREKDPT
ncbi:MAG: MotE family protein [Rhizobiaceae bacterium]|nr:MotE family protein [Rhizobiaceae bacterium]